MKVYYRNHIELIREKQKRRERILIEDMLDISQKEKKIWISGQN